MSESTNKEAELARQRNERLRHALAQKRSRSIALAVVSALIAALAWIAGFEMVAFCLAIVFLIFLLRYFDANGHLHEVRRRSDKSLVPNFSLLDAKRANSESGHSPASSEK